mgnify:CR=1 FL=1
MEPGPVPFPEGRQVPGIPSKGIPCPVFRYRKAQGPEFSGKGVRNGPFFAGSGVNLYQLFELFNNIHRFLPSFFTGSWP